MNTKEDYQQKGWVSVSPTKRHEKNRRQKLPWKNKALWHYQYTSVDFISPLFRGMEYLKWKPYINWLPVQWPSRFYWWLSRLVRDDPTREKYRRGRGVSVQWLVARLRVVQQSVGSSVTASAKPHYGLSKEKWAMRNKEKGKIGWILLWLVGIPIPILVVLYFLRGCTWDSSVKKYQLVEL